MSPFGESKRFVIEGQTYFKDKVRIKRVSHGDLSFVSQEKPCEPANTL